jgi:hypothetical protein
LDSLSAGAANDDMADRSTVILEILFWRNAEMECVTVHPLVFWFGACGQIRADPRISIKDLSLNQESNTRRHPHPMMVIDQAKGRTYCDQIACAPSIVATNYFRWDILASVQKQRPGGVLSLARSLPGVDCRLHPSIISPRVLHHRTRL